MKKLLGMFAKLWTPGEVKTRLAATLGAERTATIHRLFVETLVARFGDAADERTMVFTPPEAEAAFKDLAGDRWQVLPQTGGDLGCRMRAFFEASIVRFERVVLIGSDSPDLPAEFVAGAFAALHSHDVVLGPARDGGYYLVGAARQVPPIFDRVAWGTDRVWRQTIDKIRAADCQWHELPAWYDIDEEDALRALLLHINIEGFANPPLLRLERELLQILRDPTESVS